MVQRVDERGPGVVRREAVEEHDDVSDHADHARPSRNDQRIRTCVSSKIGCLYFFLKMFSSREIKHFTSFLLIIEIGNKLNVQ